jgi:hypothetical protein
VETRKTKTLDDFPKFIATAVRRGETAQTGYTKFEIDGQFDREIKTINPHWFWLLFGKHDCITATLISLNKETGAAVLFTHELDEPKIVGLPLYYLSPYWQAFNIWMVLDPNWGWEKQQFIGIDAVAQDYEATEISIVGDREVKIWTKLEPIEGGNGTSRHYPASNQTSPPDATPRLVPNGWGHEHCDLCKSHIDSGEFGYRDPDNRWMCVKCFDRYVVPRDLAFVDEL